MFPCEHKREKDARLHYWVHELKPTLNHKPGPAEYDEYVDFIIFGDGITSDVLSLVLKNAGKQFYVLGDDKFDQSSESPRSLALSPSSMNLLEFFGINWNATNRKRENWKLRNY